jgi:hypothetical protein
MDWIFDHLQIVVLVVIGIVSVFKSVLEGKVKRNTEQEESQSSEEYFEPEEEIYQPQRQARPSGPPPLPWGGGAVPPPLREAGYEAAVANEAAKALKHQQDLAQHLQQIRETKATTTGGAAATRARIANKGTKKTSSQVPLSLRARLKTPSELKRAFVMREILDPPVGLR